MKSIDKDGKRTYGSVYGKTFDEAKNKQDEILRNQSISSTVQAGVISNLLETSTEWMVSIQKSVKESTYLKYETIIRKHIRSHKIATTDMMKLTTKDIHNYSERLCAEGLSAKTVNDILVVLGLVLSYAEELYGITKPKIKFIKLPKKELRVLSCQEQAVLESFLFENTNSYKLGILIALYTGIRIGELCALQWDDIQGGYKINISMEFVDGNEPYYKRVQTYTNSDPTKYKITLQK